MMLRWAVDRRFSKATPAAFRAVSSARHWSSKALRVVRSLCASAATMMQECDGNRQLINAAKLPKEAASSRTCNNAYPNVEVVPVVQTGRGLH